MKPRDVTVGDLMSTALITIKEEDTLTHAEAEMRLAGIRHLPVVDDRNHLVGILSNRDVFRALGNVDGKNGHKSVSVSGVMTPRVHTVRQDTHAYRAAEAMLEMKIGALPVVGEQGQLIGILTETDFLRLAWRLLRGGTDLEHTREAEA